MTDTATKEPRKKRLPLWTKLLIGVGLILVIALIAARWYVSSSGGRGLIEATIERQTFSGQTVEIDDLKGDLLSTATIGKITLKDKNGVWAEIESVTLSWKPFAFLTGRNLDVRTFTIDTVDVARRPVIEPSEPKEKSASPGKFPLKAILLKDLKIGKFSLAEGVTPQAVSGSVKGRADWTPDRATIDLDVEPGENTGDLLAAHVNWSKASPINGKIDLKGPAGGLFASLLQLDGQSVSASFEGAGTAKIAQGDGTILIDNTRWLTIGIKPDANGYLVSSDLALAAHPLTRDQMDRLGREVRLTAQLDQSPRRKEPLKSLSVQSETLLADLTNFKLSGSRKTADISARLKKPSAFLPEDQLHLDTADFVGTVFADDNGYSLQGKLTAAGLSRPDVSMSQLSGPVVLAYLGKTVKADLDLTARQVKLSLSDEPVTVPTAKLVASTVYNLESSQLSISQFGLRTAKSQINLNGDVQLGETLTLKSTGQGKVDLAEFGLFDAGQVRADWNVRQNKPGQQTFTLNAKTSGLFDDTHAAFPWLGEKASLSAKGQLLNAKTVALSSLNLSTPALSVTGKGSATGADNLKFSGTLKTSETYPLYDTLPGLAGEFSMQGRADRLNLSTQLKAGRAGAETNSLISPVATFTGIWADHTLTGETSIAGDLQEHPLALSSDVSFKDGQWSLKDLFGAWQDLALKGDISGNGGDLSALIGELSLTGNLPETLPAKSTDITAHITGETVKADGRLEGISAGPLSGGTMTFTLAGTRESMDYDLALNSIATLGQMPQKAVVSLKGTALAPTDGEPALTGSLKARLGANNFTTDEPFRFTQTVNGLRGTLRLSGLDGKLALDLDEASHEPLSLSLADIGLSPLMAMIGNAPVNGSTSLALNFSRADDALIANVTGQLTDISVPQSSANPVSFLLDGKIDAAGGVFNLKTPDGQMLQATADVKAPIVTQAGLPYLSYNAGQKGLILVDIEGPVDNMAAIFLPDRQIVRGKTKTSLTVPLPIVPNQIEGDVSFTDGEFQHENLGTDLENINFAVTLSKGEVSLSDFTANGRKGGTLKGAGNVGFANTLTSNFEIKADKLVVVNRKEAKATASGTLGLDLTEKAIKIIGDLTLSDGLFRLDSLPSSSAPTLDVKFDTEEADAAAKAPLVSMDISLKAPRSMKLVGKGMDAELSLDAKVSGTGSSPQINGRAEIVRGKFELLGKRFDFEESEIEFRGDPMQARLNIVATRDADDFTARVTITGTPEKPDITLSAEPSLPEDEVLSRVLFGRSPSQLTGLEAARLAAALASLSGGGGFDLMGGLENLTGFDNVDVSQNENGQFQVATGRYLSDDVYMELSSGGSGSPGVSVEWEARKNVSVEAETKPEKGQTLSIQWKKDFD